MIQRHSGGDLSNDGQADESGLRRANRHGGTACECCGNEYDKPIEIVVNGISHYFDCFECAIHTLAPKCSHCGCRIIGHGVEAGGSFFCCAHCAEKQGVSEMVDRA
jgi:hypothetical protein